MRCWRKSIQRNFSRYLDGETDAGETHRMEAHLMDCGWCRARLARLRDGHRFARLIPRVAPAPDGWDALESAIEADLAQSPNEDILSNRSDARRRWLGSMPGFATPLMVIAILLMGALLASNWLSKSGERDERAEATGAFDLDGFHSVTIADIKHNTKPHVVAEGYVSEVRFDHEDGDYTFKLVEDLQQPAPFIVCEIINPIRLEPPSVGSRVRVYGVSRYDGQEGRQWHEVHPVLSIEMLGR